MDNSNDIIELLDLLYGMVNEAWGVPLGNDKCIIEREKAIEIINDIKSNLPASVAESKRLVSARDEFIGNAKREAEALRLNAEEQAAKMLDEQEIMRTAKQKSEEMIRAAEKRSSELQRVANDYVNEIMRKAEESMNAALTEIRNTQGAFRTASTAAASQPKEKSVQAEKKPANLQDIPLGIDEEDGWAEK